MTDELYVLRDAQARFIALPRGTPPLQQYTFATEVLRTVPWAAIWWLQWANQPINLLKDSIATHPRYTRTQLRTPGIAWPVLCVNIDAGYPIAPDGSIGHGSFDTIVHELGHWFSRVYNGAWGDTSKPPLGYTDEWKQVWTSITWPMDTHRADPDEALADAFAWMWMTKAGMHLQVPGRIGYGPCPQPAVDYWTNVLRQRGWSI